MVGLGLRGFIERAYLTYFTSLDMEMEIFLLLLLLLLIPGNNSILSGSSFCHQIVRLALTYVLCLT